MKYITLSFFLITLILSSCRNEDSIITEEILPVPEEATIVEIYGFVTEQFSLFSPYISRQRLNNVSVRLMHEGSMLNEVNTDETGRFAFEEQLVPLGEAYLIFEAPGFYKNVARIDSIAAYENFNYILIRKTFEALSGDAINEEGPYIRLTTGPAHRDFLAPLYFITNTNNELIGANQQYVEAPFFEITTLASEPLLFHHFTECGTQTIEMGPFSEDTDITAFLEELTFDDKSRKSIRATVFDCAGAELDREAFELFSKGSELTIRSANSNLANIGKLNCLIDNSPTTLVSVVTQNPRKYAEATVDFSSGQEDIEITICEDDDTYLNYSIGGGAEIVPNLFTYANILPNGHLILKQTDPVYPDGTHIAFQVFSSVEGINTLGDVLFNNPPLGSTNVAIVGQEIEVTINLNDGDFIEGTFDGTIYDAFESSLGNLTGTFRARIH